MEPSNKPAAPKRDKFASMAAAQQQQQQQQQSAPPASAPPRRGKFASMTAARERSASSESAASETKKDTNNDEFIKQKQKEALQKRIEQRQSVLKDLEVAEQKTWKLLELASTTTQSLSDLNFNQDEVSELSKQYRDTLQQVHSLLMPHAHFVVPYQNHKIDKQDTKKTQENKSNNMYTARVEMRLAKERQEILSEFLRLEQQHANIGSGTLSSDNTRKRPRDE